MDAVDLMVIIFIIVTAFSVAVCCLATLFIYLDYFKRKREYEKEIEHLKEERDICRSMLQRRSIQDGS